NTVDHVVPHRGDPERFWDQDGWQPLCASCHSRKTAAEDGGFGNRRPDRGPSG
ncbi:HNH endonuclease, partial [Paracoccus salipaludis]